MSQMPSGQEGLKEWRQNELAAERHNNVWRTQNYLLPLVDKIFADRTDKRSVRILSVGCGNGEDIDTIIEHGYSGFGIDTGYRSEEWAQRKHKDCFMVADGRTLPFKDGEFDMVLSFGVIEHIGAVGDTLELLPDYQEHRQRYADEILRVTKQGGYALITTPNKRFPMDMWHGPFVFGARFHSPFEKFSASYGEMNRYFGKGARCSEAKALGLQNFFQFKKTGKHLWIKLALPVIKLWINILSSSQILLRSFLNPFLIVLFKKK